MKRIFFCLLTLMTCNIGYIAAQDMVDQEASDFKEKDLTIVYIAHTTDVPLAKLTEKLEEHYRNGVQFSNEVIFYLSNGSEPYIVKVNTKGQNKDDFEAEIIDELWAKRSHDIDPFSDVENIINIVNDNDFIDENGKLKYLSVTFDFFVTESFWTMKYNESIISKLYFTLDINTIKQDNPDLYFNIHYASEGQEVNSSNKFGLKNLENINGNVQVMPY